MAWRRACHHVFKTCPVVLISRGEKVEPRSSSAAGVETSHVQMSTGDAHLAN